MIRDLPRGLFGTFLHNHYFRDKPGFLPRFTMGQGAIFSIQRVKPLETSLISPGLISETDPLMLEEMAALISALNLDVVSLSEMRRRLQQRDLKRRFVCFTFDGAYRSVLDKVLPLFKARGIPFTVYVSAEYLTKPAMPWWLALEVVLVGSGRIILEIDGEKIDVHCRSIQEKKAGYAELFKRLLQVSPDERTALLSRAFKTSIISEAEAFAQQMMSPEELKQLGQNTLVTIGSQTGDGLPLSEMSYDQARMRLQDSLTAINEATGQMPRHFAFSSTGGEAISERNIEMVQELGFESAVGHIEGALWPEHAQEMHALPRIALDNDPATLVRALMLGSDRTPISEGKVELMRWAS